MTVIGNAWHKYYEFFIGNDIAYCQYIITQLLHCCVCVKQIFMTKTNISNNTTQVFNILFNVNKWMFNNFASGWLKVWCIFILLFSYYFKYYRNQVLRVKMIRICIIIEHNAILQYQPPSNVYEYIFLILRNTFSIKRM